MSTAEIYVGNLNPEVRVRDLENCFGRYGKIINCEIKKNYAFILFGNHRDAEMAIQKENGRRLLGSDMVVKVSHGRISDGRPPFRKPHSSDRFQSRGGPRGREGPPPRPPPRPITPPMRSIRNRSPIMRGGRDRSPIGRPPMGRGRDRSPVPSGGFQSQSRNFGPRHGGREETFGVRRTFDALDGFMDNHGSLPPRNNRVPLPRKGFVPSPRSMRGPSRNERGPPPRGNNGFSPREKFSRNRPANRGPTPSDRFNRDLPVNGHHGLPLNERRGPPLNERRGPPLNERRGPPLNERRGPPLNERRGPPLNERRGSPVNKRRGPTTRMNGLSKHAGGDRFQNKRDSLNVRRNVGPRRF